MIDQEYEENIVHDAPESRCPSAKEDPSEERPVRSRRSPRAQSLLALSKADLLAKAYDREPNLFHRIDGWIAEDPCDSCSSDLHFTTTVTYQLMDGADVRVLIRPNLDRNARLRLLQQVLEHEREVPWEDLEKNIARTGSRKNRHSRATQTPSKGELFAQLCDRQPTKFHQVDAWTKDPFDGLLPSEFDDHIAATVTHELMNGADLRVLIRPDLDRATRFELIQRVLEFERRFDWEEYEWDLFARLGPSPNVDQGTGPDQEPLHESTQRVERLADRLVLTTSLGGSHAEQFRQRELEKPRPDYGTVLKDEELKELFPEAAATYHVDDVRRALLMIRMILDYGEDAFTRDDGDAVHTLLVCILDQSDYALDGTCSANSPALRVRDVPARSTSMPGLDFEDEDSKAPSDRTLQSPGLNFEDDDDDFNFEDDDLDLCSCPTDIGAKAVGADRTPRTNRRTPGQGCLYCGIVGCRACTHEEMYALDLVAAFCSFAAKEAGDLGFAMGLVRSLCDELVLAETEEGGVEWRGDTDPKIATIATRAIRDDTYLLSSLSAHLAEPDDPRISVYHEAERGALEQVRASYPDELRPADVTVVG